MFDMTTFPGNIITMISLLNIHTPVETLAGLESVTLLPTGRGFAEACILWLYTGARNRYHPHKYKYCNIFFKKILKIVHYPML